MIKQEVTDGIIGCAIKVHRGLGPGLLESAYEECLAYEMTKAGILFERQKAMPIIYDDLKLESGYRVDLFVEGRVIVELKAVDALNNVHFAQVMTYLRLANCRFGLLINFNVSLLKDGIKRVVNGY
ncbi:GxxExxY protein [Spirosoma aerophilum]